VGEVARLRKTVVVGRLSGLGVITLAVSSIVGPSVWAATKPEPRLVRDINATGSGAPNSLTAVGGTAFFLADDGEKGVELWKSDGSKAGTDRKSVV
jgi:hypothetical protein